MAGGEFALIDRYFTHSPFGQWISQGVGDDCALIDVGGVRMAVTTDMMSIGTHFFPDAKPRNVGHKALATNLSDLAAAGASPRAFFLSIALPEADAVWLSEFSAGLMDLAHRYDCALLGGDTVRTVKVNGVQAPHTISITAIGELAPGLGLMRSGAHINDDIWVSGTLGGPFAVVEKRYGIWNVPQGEAYVRAEKELDIPEPRIALGQELLRVATACADISDGFLQDLGHILDRSGVAAEIELNRIPMHEVLKEISSNQAMQAALSGGDDYELVWTAPVSAREQIQAMSQRLNLPLTRVGRVVERNQENQSFRLLDVTGQPVEVNFTGFDHFG